MGKVIGFLNTHGIHELGGLTSKRPLASTGILGRYAFMDFALSNFANSEIDDVGILVKEKPRSLIRHMGFGHSWSDNTKIGNHTIMYDEQYANNERYNTDINNFIENKWVLAKSLADVAVIAPAHILLKIDYSKIIKRHLERKSKITLVYTRIPNAKSNFIGADTVIVDEETGRIKHFQTNKGAKDEELVSLETYIISKEMLESLISYGANTSSFFSLRDTLRYIVKDIPIDSYEYKGYVRYFDSLNDYYNFSLELLNPEIRNQLFSPDWPIFTKTYDTPPSKYLSNSHVKNSFIANGCYIDGTVTNSIIGRSVVISKGAVIENSIIQSETVIAPDSHLSNCVVDKEVEVIVMKELAGTLENPLYIKREDRI